MVIARIFVFLLCASWLTTAAAAGASKISRKFDLNGDGAIDFDEFQKVLVSAFDRLDGNHDGKLSHSELTGKCRDKESMDLWLTEARMSALDADGDGFLTAHEFLSSDAMRNLFIKLDINADRLITADELGAGCLGGQTLLDNSGPS